MDVTLRYATRADAPAVNAIFGHYIANTLATFNEANKSDEQRADEMDALMQRYPFLVAECGGRLLGFANAEPVRPQSGYRYSVELTIYLSPDAPKRAGVGGMLYARLLKILTAQGFRTAYAAISGVNRESVAFHERQGFTTLALFPKSGYKNGEWLDVVWMQKTLNPYCERPEPPIPFARYVESE